MKNWSKTKKILVLLTVFFIAIQAIRPSKNESPVDSSKDIFTAVPLPDSVQQVLKRSCYDCHSNHTAYPWYDRVSPVSWWVSQHINDGKKALNFNTFNDYPAKKKSKRLKEIWETIKKDEMPLPSYLWMHGNARLSLAEKKLIMDWVADAATKISVP